MSSGFSTRVDTNRPVQLHKMARGFEISDNEFGELYHQCSENDGADYRASDLRLYFRICKIQVFS